MTAHIGVRFSVGGCLLDGEFGNMFRKIIVVSAFAASLAPFGAVASELSEPDFPDSVASSDAFGLRLAQADDVEIYYDGRGRRVIVDAYTGEIIAIQPRRETRPRRQRERANPERYYLDDPEDMARLRRDRLYELGRQAPIDEYSEFPPDPAYPREAFPEEAPYGGYNEPIEPPRTATREPFERVPLEPGLVAPDQPSDIIVEPNQPATIEPPATSAARIEVAELQVLLDRKGASPGVIDGHFGSNVDRGLVAYRELTGQVLRSTDAEGIKKALAESGGDPFINYTITAADAAGPFVAAVPADYGQKAKLERLSYTSVSEMLAERFHMDERYLKALNADANFNRVGTIIRVADVGAPVSKQVARIVADKGQKQVRAYDADEKLVAAYPATIGSSETPSPTGTHTVARIALNPEYTYNPKINFKQGDNHGILKIPPGPNGPVGSIWIALSKPTYGIHGAPDPSKIGKTESHGCVRLTNWDAQELAKIVKQGVTVEFTD
jgi:lipoprotein-anchoring transpeptidase ErfK/SrfK